MAIKQLNDDEVATWTRLQKDTWWYNNVYRGDMPQLTVRAAVTGFLLGGVLSATALYIAGKTGITIGVGLTSVILAFAMYRLFATLGAKDMTILENNATFENPHRLSTGMRDVFVNGVAVLRNGLHTGAKPGVVVRGPGYGR